MQMRSWDDAIELMTARVDSTASQVTDGFPHFSDPATGRWTTSPAGDWTGGFWNGMLWLTHYRTGDERYRELAHRWMVQLHPRAESDTVFRGFLFYYGAALGHILSGDAFAETAAIDGARGLASMFHPVARAIPLGTTAEEATDVGSTEANIDGVQGGALLAWATERTGEVAIQEVGVASAVRHIEFCLRDDDSVCQSASFDPETGEMLRRYTHKGYTDDSTWARAQAWAMLGFVMVGQRADRHQDLLDAAVAAADWWIEHAPADRVAYWDFDAPIDATTKRDTSASAIAAASLLKLAAALGEDGLRYREEAEATIRALVDGYLTPTADDDRRPPGILARSCYNHRIGLATEHELIWGDYFLYESLHVLAGHLPADLL